MSGVYFFFGGTIQRSIFRFCMPTMSKHKNPRLRVGSCVWRHHPEIDPSILYANYVQSKTPCFLHGAFLWRHHPESNWRMAILQTAALPLGYGAILYYVVNGRDPERGGEDRRSPRGGPCVKRGSEPCVSQILTWTRTVFGETLYTLAPPKYGLIARDRSIYLIPTMWGSNKWSGKRGSNPPPPPWQGGALPTELFPQMVPQSGVEPPTRGFSVPCSTY